MSTTAPTLWWLDLHAGSVQAATAVLGVIVATALLFATLRYVNVSHRLRKAATEQAEAATQQAHAAKTQVEAFERDHHERLARDERRARQQANELYALAGLLLTQLGDVPESIFPMTSQRQPPRWVECDLQRTVELVGELTHGEIAAALNAADALRWIAQVMQQERTEDGQQGLRAEQDRYATQWVVRQESAKRGLTLARAIAAKKLGVALRQLGESPLL